MAVFPGYAKLYRDPFAEQPQAVVVRTQMEKGPPKQRRRASRQMVQRPVRYALESNTDYQNFMVWYRIAINHGADWFDWTDPVDNAVKPARIVAGTFTGGSPRDKALRLWDVTFTIETWE